MSWLAVPPSALVPTTWGGYHELLNMPRFWCALFLLPLNAFCPYIFMLFLRPLTIHTDRHRRFIYLLVAEFCLYLGSVLLVVSSDNVRHKEQDFSTIYSHVLALLHGCTR